MLDVGVGVAGLELLKKALVLERGERKSRGAFIRDINGLVKSVEGPILREFKS
jgi:hypothetical protein